MPIRRFSFVFWLSLSIVLAACGGGALDLNLRLDKDGGLKAGAPIVVDDAPVGQVLSVEPDPSGGVVAKLKIQSEFRDRATEDARFIVTKDPGHPETVRVELRPGRAGTPLLADGTTVQGSVESEAFFPFRELLKGFTQGLGTLRDQVEQFRSQMQQLPQSKEGKQLKEQWERLQEDLKKAQEDAEDSVKQELIPKLQQQLEEIHKRFEALEARPDSDSN